jgi:hypothetical protein
LVLALALAPAVTDVDVDELPRARPLRLDRTDDGGYRHRDRDAGFEATIDPDGTVTFRDIAPVRVEFPRPKPPEQREEDGDPNRHPQPQLELLPPGSLGPLPMLVSVGLRFGGRADLGKQRKSLAKRKLLQQTAELRAKMAAQSRGKREREALFVLMNDLASLWKDDTRTAAAKRRAIFEVWDDCDEGNTGVRARARIEAFVRQHVTGAVGFTQAELAKLNAERRSSRQFDPYATRRDPAK